MLQNQENYKNEPLEREQRASNQTSTQNILRNSSNNSHLDTRRCSQMLIPPYLSSHQIKFP